MPNTFGEGTFGEGDFGEFESGITAVATIATRFIINVGIDPSLRDVSQGGRLRGGLRLRHYVDRRFAAAVVLDDELVVPEGIANPLVDALVLDSGTVAIVGLQVTFRVPVTGLGSWRS